MWALLLFPNTAYILASAFGNWASTTHGTLRVQKGVGAMEGKWSGNAEDGYASNTDWTSELPDDWTSERS